MSLLCQISKNDKYFRKMALTITKNEFEADELVQEMYLKLHRYNQTKLLEMIEKGVIKFVCVRILKQLFIDNCRTKKINQELTENISSENDFQIDERIEKVKYKLSKLNWYDRMLFEIYIYEDHTMRSLSNATQIPLTEIWKSINRSKKILKKAI